MTLECVLALIASEGWLVQQLGQFSDGSWRATLERPEEDGVYVAPYRHGATMTEALTSAYSVLHLARFIVYARPDAGSLTAPAFSLATLGLGTPPPLTFTLAKRFAR